MHPRVLVRELLDHLAPDDPEAMRSRRDLRRINFLMGNERWLCRSIERFQKNTAAGIAEVGAGDGILCAKLAKKFPSAPVLGYDLAPRPPALPSRVKWLQGDLFTQPRPQAGGIVIANLFLHHFEGEALSALGSWLADAEVLIFNEPDRARLPHLLGALLWPFINRVTHHDLHVSIAAGFSSGEIADLLGLESQIWNFEETSTWRGGRSMVAWRQ